MNTVICGCINFHRCSSVGRAYTLCDLKQALLLELNGGYASKFQLTFLAHPNAPPATERRIAFVVDGGSKSCSL